MTAGSSIVLSVAARSSKYKSSSAVTMIQAPISAGGPLFERGGMATLASAVVLVCLSLLSSAGIAGSACAQIIGTVIGLAGSASDAASERLDSRAARLAKRGQ